jgi:hypothetical protein
VLELYVLGVLAAGPTYGYAITQSLEEAGLGTVRGGTLYPPLARLQAEDLVVSSWDAGEGGVQLPEGTRSRRGQLPAQLLIGDQRAVLPGPPPSVQLQHARPHIARRHQQR